jgi:hypothetical protein
MAFRNTQTPTVGRIVHYQAHGSPNGQHKSRPRAAVITEVIEDAGVVNNDVVDLAVLNPTGMYFNQGCLFDPDGGPGTWRWPPRV